MSAQKPSQTPSQTPNDLAGGLRTGGAPSRRRHVLYLAVAGAVMLAALLAASRLAALIRPAWPQQPRAWVDLEEPEPAGAGPGAAPASQQESRKP